MLLIGHEQGPVNDSLGGGCCFIACTVLIGPAWSFHNVRLWAYSIVCVRHLMKSSAFFVSFISAAALVCDAQACDDIRMTRWSGSLKRKSACYAVFDEIGSVQLCPT